MDVLVSKRVQPASPPVKLQQNYRKRRDREELPKRGTAEWAVMRQKEAKTRRDESELKYCCPNCPYAAAVPSKLKRHMTLVHTAYPCEQCEDTFETYNLLRKHVSVVHPKLHNCDLCSYSSQVKAELKKHYTKNHANGILCTVRGCNVIVAKNRLKTHIAEVHLTDVPVAGPSVVEEQEAPTYSCSACEYTTLVLEELDIHVDSAHRHGIRCPVPECEEQFPLSELQSHLNENHPDDVGLQPSTSSFNNFEVCRGGASVVTRSETIDSVTTATTTSGVADEDLFSDWEEEGNGGLRRKGLAKRTHDGRFACTTCEKAFSSLYLLRKHIRRTHENAYRECKRARIAKYECDWGDCKKSFKTPGLLADHMNGHRGLQPYRCNHCEKSFSARARFAVHLSKYHQTSIRSVTAMGQILNLKQGDAAAEASKEIMDSLSDAELYELDEVPATQELELV